MRVVGAGNAVVLLIIVSAIVAFQMAVLLTHPTTSDLIEVYAGQCTSNGGRYCVVGGVTYSNSTSTSSTSSSVSASSSVASTSQAATTQSQPPPSTPSAQTVTTSITLSVQPEVIYAQDYTPIGVAVVAAVGIVGLVMMFLKRMR